MRNFELTKETKTFNHNYEELILHRIICVKDFENQGDIIKAGTIGGWVQSLDNLDDTSWVADEAIVCDFVFISNNSRVQDNAQVLDSVQVDLSIIKGNAKLDEKVGVYKGSVISDDVYLTGEVEVSDSIISGNVTICESFEVSHGAILSGNFTICDNFIGGDK